MDAALAEKAFEALQVLQSTPHRGHLYTLFQCCALFVTCALSVLRLSNKAQSFASRLLGKHWSTNTWRYLSLSAELVTQDCSLMLIILKPHHTICAGYSHRQQL